MKSAPAVLPRRDALVLWAVPTYFAALWAADHRDAFSYAIFWMPLLPHPGIGPELSQR